jgi:hypothetical protein
MAISQLVSFSPVLENEIFSCITIAHC